MGLAERLRRHDDEAAHQLLHDRFDHVMKQRLRDAGNVARNSRVGAAWREGLDGRQATEEDLGRLEGLRAERARVHEERKNSFAPVDSGELLRLVRAEYDRLEDEDKMGRKQP
jgi:hypothetical protein